MINDRTVSHSDIEKILKNIRISNNNKLIFGHLNINSQRDKFDSLSKLFKDSIDILMVPETKRDDMFP